MDELDQITVRCACGAEATYNVLESTPQDDGWYVSTHHYRPNDEEWSNIKGAADRRAETFGKSKTVLRRKHQRAPREVVRCPDCAWNFEDLDIENLLQ